MSNAGKEGSGGNTLTYPVVSMKSSSRLSRERFIYDVILLPLARKLMQLTLIPGVASASEKLFIIFFLSFVVSFRRNSRLLCQLPDICACKHIYLLF